MNEDKLTHDERLRLECIAQAVASSGAIAGRVQTSRDLVERAIVFEKYIRDGKE